MNSSTTTADKMYRSAFQGCAYQVDIINEVNLFLRAKFLRTFFSILNGIVKFSRSLISLFTDMKPLYSMKYIQTRKLNQDILESTFGILRQMGFGNEHLDTVSLKYRMPRFILSRKHAQPSEHG